MRRTDALHDSCGECPSCRKIQRGSHPDVFFVEADGQFIRINAIREIQEQMKFKPLEARWRVFIIDDADKMNDQAANALLKTLEEPSPVQYINFGYSPAIFNAIDDHFALPAHTF